MTFNSTPAPVESVSLWPADWSQFVPDAILTLIAGLAIGTLLWRWQKNADRRATRQAAESNWQMARPHFMAVADPLELNGDEYYLGLAVATLDPLIKQGRNYPIAAWAEASPKNRELATLRELLIHAPTVQRLAAELSLHYRQEIVRLGDAPESSTDLFERAATYLVLGLKAPPYLEGSYTEVAARHLKDDALGARLVREFRGVLNKVQLDLDVLRVHFFGP